MSWTVRGVDFEDRHAGDAGRIRASPPEREPREPNVTGEYRAGDIRHCFADVSRARELLGFEATVTLERELPELAAWVAGQSVSERGDEAVAELRARGLVA